MLVKLQKLSLFTILFFSLAAVAQDNAPATPEANEDNVVGPLTAEEHEANISGKKISVASFINAGGEIVVENITLGKNILAEVYSPRDYKTIWFNGKNTNADFDKAMDFISLADENGLSLKKVNPDIITKRLKAKDQNEEFIAKTDALITHMVLEMIQIIGNGDKISDKLDLQTYFERPVRIKNSAQVFEEFMKEPDGEKIIEKYSPKHPQYAALKNSLKYYIKKFEGSRNLEPIKFRRNLVVGDKDSTIAEIRRKVGAKISISPNANNDTYDKALADKINEYRKKFRLKENAVIDKEFVEGLNRIDNEAISRIKANMERYRWLPDDLAPTRIEVNLANFRLSTFKNGEKVSEMGTISGKLEHKTPIMTTKLYQMNINPFWNVPRAYGLRNLVPLLKQDPKYIVNQNFELFRLEKDGWKKIEQSSVDWNKVNENNYNYQIRQRPGNPNVLGPIKFAIINPYDIFLHSTSEPWLFTNNFRGYSSGCIRIEEPVAFAKYLIDVGEIDVSEARFDELYNAYNNKDGKPVEQRAEVNDKTFKLKKPIDIYTFYFTAKPNEDGTVEFSEDIYDLDFDQANFLEL